jgi:phage shock protein E
VTFKNWQISFFILLLLSCTAKNAVSQEKTLSFAQLKKIILDKTDNYLLADVRTNEEYLSGHIPTAVNIPYDTISTNLPATDKEILLIVYCRSGRRSKIAAHALFALGYKNVIDFGGISNWQAGLNQGTDP